jgi:pimeloyl-ACP methyl ester carboxylesterase
MARLGATGAVVTTAIVSMAFLVAALVGASAEGRRMIPTTRAPITATPAADGLRYEDVSFRSDHGLVLRGWWIPGAGARTIVMIHPWGANRGVLLDRVSYLHLAGYNLLLFDLSGHGQSDGDPQSVSYLSGDDVRAAVTYARARASGPVALLGYSLGAALAIQVAARDPDVTAVVEDSGFASIPAVFGANFESRTGLPAQPFALPPEVVGSLVFRVNLWGTSPLEDAARLHQPLLAIVGSADAIVPPSEGASLYRAAAGPKQLLVVPGATHAWEYETDKPLYERTVIGFLRSSLA